MLVFLLIAAVPFSNYNINIGFAVKPFMIMSVIAFIYYLSDFMNFASNKSLTINLFERRFLLFIILFSSTIVLAEYKLNSLRLIFGFVIVMFSYLMFKYSFKQVSIECITKSVYLVGIIFNITSLLLYLAGVVSVNFNFHGNQFTSFGLMLDRNVPRLIGVHSDPNFFVFYNLIFLSIFIYFKKSKLRFLWIALSMLNVLLTMSRSGIIAVSVMLTIIIISSPIVKSIKSMRFKANTWIKIILAIIVTIIIIVTTITVLDIDLFSSIIARFKTKDGGSGRVRLVQNGIEMFKQSGYLGIGIYNFQPMNVEMFQMQHYMHNTIMEVFVEGGIIVFGVYIYSLLTLMKMALSIAKFDRRMNYLFATLIGSIVMMTTLSMIINEMLMLIFVLINVYFESMNEVESDCDAPMSQ